MQIIAAALFLSLILMSSSSTSKVPRVYVVGQANIGKSTLISALSEIGDANGFAATLVDTEGFHLFNKRPFEDYKKQSVSVDLVLYCMELSGIDTNFRVISTHYANRPVIIVICRGDLVTYDEMNVFKSYYHSDKPENVVGWALIRNNPHPDGHDQKPCICPKCHRGTVWVDQGYWKCRNKDCPQAAGPDTANAQPYGHKELIEMISSRMNMTE